MSGVHVRYRHPPCACPTTARTRRREHQAPGRRDLAEAGLAALAAFALTAAIEVATARGALLLVLHPLYLATLAVAALLGALAVRRLRALRALHATALVAVTFALQRVLLVVWGAGVSWMLAVRG